MEIPVIGVEPRGAPLRKVAAWRARANRRAKAAVVSVKDQRFSAPDGATGIRIEMGAPVRRPLSAVPRIESIVMLAARNAVIPMIVEINVIEAHVIVFIMVAPAPSIRPPPRMEPGSEPEPVAEPEAKAHSPIIGKACAESIGAWTTDPITSDVGRVVPARAINHHVVWTDLSAKVARSVTDVHIVGS